MRCIFRIAIAVAAVVVLYGAWIFGTNYGLKHAPGTTVIVIGILAATILTIGGFFGSRFYVLGWHWDQFASKFQKEAIPDGANAAKGLAVVNGRRHCLTTAVTEAGIVIESAVTRSRPTAIIPWSVITRITRSTIVQVRKKRCKPFAVAEIYLSEPHKAHLLLPWNDSFDSLIPERVGFEHRGEGNAVVL